MTLVSFFVLLALLDLLFYLIASVLHNNFAFTLVHGAIGCLCFAIYGRFLLGILLKNSMLSSSVSTVDKNIPSNPSNSQNPQSVKRNLGKYPLVKILIRVMSVNQW